MKGTTKKARTMTHHPISPTARKLLRALLKYQKQKRFIFRRVYRPEKISKRLITYGELRTAAHVSAPPVKIGFYLGEIARFCLANHIPPLNALVVNGKSRVPGGAYEGTSWERDAFATLICRYPTAKELMPYARKRSSVGQ